MRRPARRGPRSRLRRSRRPCSGSGPVVQPVPIRRPADEGRAIAGLVRGVEVEVVARDHQNLRRLEAQPARRRGVGLGVGFVDGDHLTRDDGVPGHAVAARRVDDERCRQHRERHHRQHRLEPGQRLRKVRPGIEAVPGMPDVVDLPSAEAAKAEVRKGLVEGGPVDVVHVEAGAHLAHDCLHRQPSPVIGDLVPVQRHAVGSAGTGQRMDQSAVPVQHRAASIEGECLDSHVDSPVEGRCRRAHGPARIGRPGSRDRS